MTPDETSRRLPEAIPERMAPVEMAPEQMAQRAAERLSDLTGVEKHDVCLVMGSGWCASADALGSVVAELSVSELPGFAPMTVDGHTGTLRSVRIDDRNVLVYLGRTHLYEGLGVRPVVHGVRTAAAAGCSVTVLTNGCGSLRESWPPGTPVLIKDHINLTGSSPVEGATFVDLGDLYSRRLRDLCRELDPSLDEGVYVQFRGPHYETGAEIAMVDVLGGDLVGMSTALEAIAARQAGMEVLGISLVTNLAAGVGDEALNHEDVLGTGTAAAGRVGQLLSALIRRL